MLCLADKPKATHYLYLCQTKKGGNVGMWGLDQELGFGVALDDEGFDIFDYQRRKTAVILLKIQDS